MMPEKNRMIGRMLKKDICSRDLFETFACFANGFLNFNDVLEQAHKEAVDFKALVENEGLDYEAIQRGE